LDTEEGEVAVWPDEPQPSGNTEEARIAAMAGNLTRRSKARGLGIFERLCSPLAKSSCFQDAYQQIWLGW
jgi:hypothetical protein